MEKYIDQLIEKGIKQGKIRTYSPENKHLFSKEAQIFFDNIENYPHKMFTSGYWKKQKEQVIKDTKKAFHANPKPTAKQTIINILSELPDSLPIYNITEVTTYITKEWERLEQQITQKETEILVEVI